MKDNANILNAITNDYHNEVKGVLHAEWNMNRFYTTLVDNTPSDDSEGYDAEMFPIESIAKPNRPTAGICKAVVGQATVEPTRHTAVPSARYYLADPDDEYKYWQSPTSGNTLTDCAPHVLYVDEDTELEIDIVVNKILFTIENTYSYPTSYDVQTKTAAGNWTTVASDIAIPTNGKVELWYDGAAWSTTQNLDNLTALSGVRLVVNTMNAFSFFNLIELGLAQERDLSDDVVQWNNGFTMGESDFITPLGNISTNTGSVTLFDSDGTYDRNNEASEFYGILDKGVRLRGYLVYGSDTVQDFEAFSENWEVNDGEAIVSTVDAAEIFMTTKPRPVLYRDVPVQEAVWRICDTIGFNNYEVTAVDEETSIDIFWTDGEKTAWEVFAELSRATQTAIYFDYKGVLQIKTRNAAWDSTKTSSYHFNRDTVPGGAPANIVGLTEANDYEANKVTVSWTPTQFSERRDWIVPMEVVWEPEGAVVLRATALDRNFNIGDNVLHLQTREGKTWPWEGIANIGGEWISFDAKRYIWYDETNTRRVSWIESHDEQKDKDARGGPFYRHRNKYTGALRVSERGLFNTEEKNHRIDLNNWNKIRRRNYSNNYSPCTGIRLNRGHSTVTMQSTDNADMKDYTYLTHGNGVDQGYRYLGFRMKIDKSSHKHKTAGLFFCADDGVGSGYYLEVVASQRINGKMRNHRNEVSLYSMKSDGSKKFYGGKTIRLKDKSKNHKKGAVVKEDIGARHAVPMGSWIDFDIWYVKNEANDRIQVWANGIFLFESIVPDGSGWRHARVSRFGLYVRGHSKATFEYIYGINSTGVEKTDSESYYDRIEGGYYSTQAHDWTFGTRDSRRKVRKRWTKYQQRYQQRFYDDFGPIAHEIREFDVKFTSETPVLESRLYFSNTSQVVCTEYTGDTTNGKFLMANISREPAVVSGDDERTARGNGTINHKLFVYGRPVIQKDAQEIKRTDDWAQRRRGTIEIDYNSIWIQNEPAAREFAKWLTTHWSRSDLTLNVEVFGNPLVELTDVVRVTYGELDDYFYVTSVTNTFENGLATELTLRKVSDYTPA